MIWRVLAVICMCLADPSTAGPQPNNNYYYSSSFQNQSNTKNALAGADASSLSSISSAVPCTSAMDVFRLPVEVFPVSYVLEVATDFEDFTFSGRVEIEIKSSTSACRVVLNAKDLRINEIEVLDQKLGTPLSLKDHYPMEKNEQYIIVLNDTYKCLIPERSYVVKVDFEGSLRDDMSGYYKSSYKENNVTKWLAITKFDPFHTKKAFPCFDEPALKAPFKISLKRRYDQISLSNMPLLNSTRIGKTNMYWDHYQETPPISTYLVGFFVGEYYGTLTRNIGIYTHKSYLKQVQYLLDEAPKLLQEMENFTAIDFMLPKLDILAIPDFSAGAMENWGLNAYREILSLLSENSKTKIKEYLTTIVQHEISHQWFGDLVTCAWWDYIWLNEGFATYFQYLATNEVEPDWRLEDVFVYEVHQLALQVDQMPMHPISGSVKTILEIRAIFDDISYSKAGTVLRMLQYTVTKDNFKKALHFYLETNKYKAVTPENLWSAFDNILIDNDFELNDNISVTQYMKSWTEQSGYPLVKINRVNNSFVISQERFLVYGANKSDSTEWIIGLTYTTENEKDFNNVLPKTWLEEKKIVLPSNNESGWYIFNLQSIGFYRVNYEIENWNALIEQLHNNCTEIHVLNRAQIIDDLFNLAKINEVDYNLVMNAIQYLKNEVDVVPWYSVKKGFEYLLERMYRFPEGFRYLKAYVRYLAGLIYDKIDHLVIKQNNTEHSIRTGWNAFSYWACMLDDESCTKNSLSYFKSWQQGKIIPADIKDAAFCVGVKYGNSEVWNSILNIYVTSESASDRHSAQMGLACSRDSIQLANYLNFMFEKYDSPIRPQDFQDIYQPLASSPEGVSALVDLLSNKLDRIVNEIIDGEQVAMYIYSLVSSKITFDEDILKIDKLRKDSSVPADLRKRFNFFYQAVEANLAWFNTNYLKITQLANTTVNELGIHLDTGYSDYNSTVVSEITTEMSPTSEPSMDVFRLPTDVLPVSYTLEIDTNFDDFTFSGRVEIEIKSNVSTCQVVLNSKDLVISNVEVIDQMLNTVPIVEHYPVEKNEQYIIVLNQSSNCLIPEKLYLIKIAFQAPLRDDMSGYYRSSYKENGVTKWLTITKFDPFHTKKAFPCFDEPALKAPFKISIKRRSNQISLSNMPLLNSTKIGKTNMYWDHYQETPPLSTYLVGYFVGEYSGIKTNNIGIYTHKSYLRQTEYLAYESPKLLQEMENFTGVDYMLPKLDLLAIPDFSAGAMENWGLNAYREILSLLSENSKTKIKEYLTTIVQHEISHQWFGDLVTCAWWDYIWLNEGFATYFQYLATNEVKPDWRLEDVFVYEVHQLALQVDQTPKHPISGSVKTILEIRAIFDDISYSKAGTILRMLQYTVTKDNFKKALHFYLEKNKYKAVTPEDLWIAFEYVLKAAEFKLDEDISVTKYMKSWTEQSGYPLVKVRRENNLFVITQERFLVYGINDTDSTQWIIGLTYTTENEKDFNRVIPKTWLKGQKTVLPNPTENGWYIFNLQSIGFYRVNYEEDNWNALIDQLHNDCSLIHVLNRAQIIDDLFNLAKVNEVDYTLVFKAIHYIIKEDDVVPWYSVKNGFEYLLNRMWRSQQGFKYLKAYVRYLSGLIYDKIDHLVIKQNNTEHSIRTGWNAFSYWACMLDDESCTKNSLSYFKSWQQGKIIPADIKDAAFCVGVKYGNSEVWNSILNVYVTSESASDRHSAQMGLACSRDSIQLSKYLNFMFRKFEGPIRPQDFQDIYQPLASSQEGVSALVDLLSNNLDRILNEIIDGEQVAMYIYSLVSSRVASDEDILKIDNLRKKSTLPAYLRKRFDFCYQATKANLDWFNTYNNKITQISNSTLHELGIDLDKDQSVTDSPASQSSSTTLSVPAFMCILPIVLSTFLQKIFYLF